LVALLLGSLPFAGMCLSVSLWDRVAPVFFGLPFNLLWLLLWILLSSLCMGVAYRLESASGKSVESVE
jgi:hypothetical protein